MINHDMKGIIAIVGGGFGGLRVALDLDKVLKSHSKLAQQYRIVLIDKNSHHLFVPAIYEIASTTREDAVATKLKEAVSVPYEQIFHHTRHIEFVCDAVEQINPDKKEITLRDNGALSFDYAVIAVGSDTNFYGIAGLEEASQTLKDIPSAVRLRNAVRENFDKTPKDKTLQIVIGGGGVSGVELAGELEGYLDRINKKLAEHKHWQITVLQGNETILPGFPKKIISLAHKRLRKLGVQIFENELVSSVTQNQAQTASGKKFPFDLLVWAGGIKPAPLADKLPFKKDKRGRIAVDDFFEPYTNDVTTPYVFVVGDSCCFLSDGESLPATSWSAISQGSHIAKLIYHRLTNQTKPMYYRPLSMRYIVPIKGKYAIFQLGNLTSSGLHVWLLKELVYLRYLAEILPLRIAIPKWLRAFWLFTRND